MVSNNFLSKGNPDLVDGKLFQENCFPWNTYPAKLRCAKRAADFLEYLPLGTSEMHWESRGSLVLGPLFGSRKIVWIQGPETIFLSKGF